VLVARREFGERIRSRAFQASTAATLLVVAAVAILAGVLGGDDTTDYKVGAQGPEAIAMAAVARETGPAFDVKLEVERFDSAAATRRAVRDERVDAALAGGALISRESPPDELEQALQAAARQVRAGETLRREGVSEADARRALDPPPLQVRALEGGDDDERQGVAFVASLLLYMQLILYGLAVASGVVEEKASRVVEVLLAAIPARAILAGKIAGIGLLGLLQLALVAVVGLGLASASGAIELEAGDAGVLAVVLVWFLLGFVLWASLYAIAGVIVSRQEDLQTTTTPLTVVLVVCYLLAFPALDDPGSSLAVVSSLVPLSSPIIMPARVAIGEAGAFEIVASLGLLAASIGLLVPLGARIYEGAVLRMGKPLKLSEALRATQ
jgi:ABC-2 type transport system permease protein